MYYTALAQVLQGLSSGFGVKFPRYFPQKTGGAGGFHWQTGSAARTEGLGLPSFDDALVHPAILFVSIATFTVLLIRYLVTSVSSE